MSGWCRGVGLLVGVASVGVALFVLPGCSEQVPRPGLAAATGAETAGDPTAVAVLREWDERRAAAYASGSVAGLRRLYVEGSAAGSADVRRLRAYVRRGMVVTGMRMQLLEVEELLATTDLLRVRVTDRLVGAVARRAEQAIALPRDSASSHVVTMRRVGGAWRVESVQG